LWFLAGKSTVANLVKTNLHFAKLEAFQSVDFGYVAIFLLCDWLKMLA
jgi:hypothetical protein